MPFRDHPAPSGSGEPLRASDMGLLQGRRQANLASARSCQGKTDRSGAIAGRFQSAGIKRLDSVPCRDGVCTLIGTFNPARSLRECHQGGSMLPLVLLLALLLGFVAPAAADYPERPLT